MKLAISLALAGLIAEATAATCGSCAGCLWTYSGGSQCFDASAAPQVACDGWGAGYTWCGDGPTPSTTQPSTPQPTNPPSTTQPSTTTAPPSTYNPPSSTKVFFSPYNDLGIWASRTQLPSIMSDSGLETVTLAFATGECGSESWAGSQPSEIKAIIDTLVAKGKKYVISTGGAAGGFTCGSDAGFAKFINNYKTDNLVGIDFDIETSQSYDVVTALAQRVKTAQSSYPNLRFSFTIACFGASNGGDPLNTVGQNTVKAIKASGLSKYFVNLMAMDYGAASPGVCVVENGLCEMGKSANQAAENLKATYGIPYANIELTVMIGGNDVASNVFKLEDVAIVASYAKSKGLGGLHHWSVMRDVDCVQDYASPTCNSYGKAGKYGFTKEFIKQLA